MINKKMKVIGGITLTSVAIAGGAGVHSYQKMKTIAYKKNIVDNTLLAKNNEDSDESETSSELVNNEINVENVWSQALFTLGFNANKTFKITEGWSETNPYYTGTDSFSIIIRNSQGVVLSQESYKGAQSIETDVYNALNGKSFQYGDTIEMFSNSGAHFTVNNVTETGTLNYEITANGLKKISSNLSNEKAMYEGKSTTISGKTSPNEPVYLNIGGKIYTTVSDSSGDFSYSTTGLKPGDKVSITPANSTTTTTTVQYNFAIQPLTNSKITLYGNWGGYYSVDTISFNPYTMKFMATPTPSNGRTLYLDGATTLEACGFTLYNSESTPLSTKTFIGADTANDVANYLNSLSFNYGDYFKVSLNGMEASVDNGKVSGNDVFGLIGKNKFMSIDEPTLSFEGNQLDIASDYNGGTANISVLGHTYTEKVENGKAVFTIPSDIPINTKMTVSVSQGEIKTLPQVVYTSYQNNQSSYNYNMYRYGSISPTSKLGMKGDDMSLTAYEPVPLEFSGKAQVSVDLKGNITGSAGVWINTGSGLDYIGSVQANTPTTINIPTGGNLMFDTSDIDDKGASITQGFSFTTNVTVKSGYYRQIPVFDNRGFIKIDPSAYTNSQAFLKAIMSPQNINHGAILIGDHVRMYVANAGQSLPSNLNAADTVNWYNQTFISDNELNGLSQTATNPLNRFHTNNFFIYSDTSAQSDGWWTGGDGTDAIPGMFKIGLTTPGWVTKLLQQI